MMVSLINNYGDVIYYKLIRFHLFFQNSRAQDFIIFQLENKLSAQQPYIAQNVVGEV